MISWLWVAVAACVSSALTVVFMCLIIDGSRADDAQQREGRSNE